MSQIYVAGGCVEITLPPSKKVRSPLNRLGKSIPPPKLTRKKVYTPISNILSDLKVFIIMVTSQHYTPILCINATYLIDILTLKGTC